MKGKRFQRGLVIGKFSPLHHGHELVIQRAQEESHEVVIISYSKPEFSGCDAGARERWLACLFPAARRLVVTDELLAQHGNPSWPALPANEADATTHRRFCAFLCQDVLGVAVDAVFTSESYGDGFAAELTRCFQAVNPAATAVTHVNVDEARRAVPVSGTLLRQDVHAHRDWLAPEVYASFVDRICLLGGESSGKSTLATELGRVLRTACVAEYGREFWEARGGALVFDDMAHIAQTQVAMEEATARRAWRYLICDTSPLTTLFYSEHLFQRVDPVLAKLAERRYAATILCAPDFEFVQDGTRQPASFRARQHEWYLRELEKRQRGYLLVTGSIEQRVGQVLKHLQKG